MVSRKKCHQIDIVAQDQLLYDLGGPVRVGLTVPQYDLKRIGRTTDRDFVLGRLFDLFDRPWDLLAEDREWSRLRRNQTDLDRRCRGDRITTKTHRNSASRCSVQHLAPAHCRCHVPLP
jgi:hypothetical protein